MYGVPGVGFAILKKGQLIASGFGVTNVDNPQPVTPDTIFALASISKTVTTTAMMRLVEQGKVDLNAPVKRSLPDFKVQMVGFVSFFVLATLIPLMVFAPRLAAAKRAGLGDAGRLGSRYARRFEEKWFRGGASSDEELLGSADIQSLADLGNSMAVVQEMRVVPFGWRDVTRLVVITAIPFLPLLFTIFSLEDFASYLIKTIF